MSILSCILQDSIVELQSKIPLVIMKQYKFLNMQVEAKGVQIGSYTVI